MSTSRHARIPSWSWLQRPDPRAGFPVCGSGPCNSAVVHGVLGFEGTLPWMVKILQNTMYNATRIPEVLVFEVRQDLHLQQYVALDLASLRKHFESAASLSVAAEVLKRQRTEHPNDVAQAESFRRIYGTKVSIPWCPHTIHWAVIA